MQDSVTHKNMTYFIIKLRFVGISQADRDGRKCGVTKTRFDFAATGFCNGSRGWGGVGVGGRLR